MLNEHQQHQLADIESRIASEDPALDRALRSMRAPQTGSRSRRLLQRVAFIAILCGPLACLLAIAAGPGFVTLILLMVVIIAVSKKIMMPRNGRTF